MLNKLIKTITVLALTIGGSIVAMQQQPRAGFRKVCSGGQCRLVKIQQAGVPVARGVAAAPVVASPKAPSVVATPKGSIAAPAAATSGRITTGLTPAQTASQKAQFNSLIEAQRARTGIAPAAAPASTQGSWQAIPTYK